MDDVHGVAALPDGARPGQRPPASDVAARVLRRLRAPHDLPVLRPVRVDQVTERRKLLTVAPTSGAGRPARSSTPPARGPGLSCRATPARDVRGRAAAHRRLPGAGDFAGHRVLVVGGARQPSSCSRSSRRWRHDWVTRRPPLWRIAPTSTPSRAAPPWPGSRTGPRGPAAAERRQRHRPGPAPPGGGRRRRGVYRRHPMFERITPTGVHGPTGGRAGRRDPVGHRLPSRPSPTWPRSSCATVGGIQLDGTTAVRRPPRPTGGLRPLGQHDRRQPRRPGRRPPSPGSCRPARPDRQRPAPVRRTAVWRASAHGRRRAARPPEQPVRPRAGLSGRPAPPRQPRHRRTPRRVGGLAAGPGRSRPGSRPSVQRCPGRTRRGPPPRPKPRP